MLQLHAPATPLLAGTSGDAPRAGKTDQGRPTLAALTSRDLERVDRADTTRGVAALQLAELIDAGGYTAQGAAALVKAHREALDLALEGTAKQADVIDLIFRDAQ